ncbi:hypothetical protein P9265_07600 [Schinkia azotoformans]|uniref:hypothetical protein n=1 Tax=Schinkia azotoformans TaxID=1454 RepID=UPI002E1FFBAB|nr:hypothetical protein [Schinkia azotoformans]
MKNVMARAWKIAKEGQNKFGGKVSKTSLDGMDLFGARQNGIEDELTAVYEVIKEIA